MDAHRSVDLVIIGAGTAGISAFKEAIKFTKNIILIDHGPLGTTCARVGCMPSKVIMQVADEYHARQHFAEIGIEGAEHLTINIPQVMKHVRRLRDYFTSGTIKFLKSLNDQFILGSAEFVGLNRIKVNNEEIEAKQIIIATGTSSIYPPEWKVYADAILTSETIFEQPDFKKKIAVIGAGPIGLELGQGLSRLGVDVEMFHSHDFIGGLSDPVVNDYAIEMFKAEFGLHLGEEAKLSQKNNQLVVTHAQDEIKVDQVLAALGRRPDLSGLHLDRLGIEMDESGLPVHDKTTMQLKGMPIFIAGDVDKFRPLLHEAADEGRIAGFNAMQEKAHCFKRRTSLMILFTQPNIAVVGRSFASLKAEDFIIGEARFDDQGRSRIMSANKGILRVYAAKENGEIFGAEMLAPVGEHLAHLLAWAIQQKMTVYDVLSMPFYHPTVEEGMRTALRHAGQLVKKQNQESFDLVMCDSEAVPSLS